MRYKYFYFSLGGKWWDFVFWWFLLLFFFLACKISIHKARQPGVLSVRDKHLLSLPALFDR